MKRCFACSNPIVTLVYITLSGAVLDYKPEPVRLSAYKGKIDEADAAYTRVDLSNVCVECWKGNPHTELAKMPSWIRL